MSESEFVGLKDFQDFSTSFWYWIKFSIFRISRM